MLTRLSPVHVCHRSWLGSAINCVLGLLGFSKQPTLTDAIRPLLKQTPSWCNRPDYTPAGLYPGLKRPRLDYTRVYYSLGQFIPPGILWPRRIHTPSGQIILP